MLVHTLLVLSAVTSLAQSELSFRPGFKEDVKFPERWLVMVKVDSGNGKEVKTE